jgi:hypothetical protein
MGFFSFTAKVNELNTHFDKCQQLLNSISSSINAKAAMVIVYSKPFISFFFFFFVNLSRVFSFFLFFLMKFNTHIYIYCCV